MEPSVAAPTPDTSPDTDLADQARPGYGIPSQDLDPAAQSRLSAKDAEREASSVLAGGAAVVGVATGATIGVIVAGPAGVVVGAALGAVAGALGGVAAGAATKSE